MEKVIRGFAELEPELRQAAGGKGAMLSRMVQGDYPVPEGFVVLPAAFTGEYLKEEAWEECKLRLKQLRRSRLHALFAVRSSAFSEDSAGASFAGEFETVLSVDSDADILKAIYAVFHSKDAERVQVYSAVQGMEAEHPLAVVVQLMVQSEISGVLFTADPITGSRITMPGNYVYGLGEPLVSGESNAMSFSLSRKGGKYEGPREFKKYASTLAAYAARLERELGAPQDIEWAVAGGEVFLLQTRPITTLSSGNRDTYEINDSLSGDYLWTNNNVGESIADVCTPLSWSVLRALDEEHTVITGQHMFSGNICGRVYANVSLSVSMFSAFGLNPQPILHKMSRVFGVIPEGMSVPQYPFSRRELIRTALPRILYSIKRTREAVRGVSQQLSTSPTWCREMTKRLQQTDSREQLLRLWNTELWPQNVRAMWSGLEAAAAKMQQTEKLLAKLGRLMGEEDAHLLLASTGEGAELASLGPMKGIFQVMKGELSRSEYAAEYGHRGPHEFELSVADPGEDTSWLEQQIAEFQTAAPDVNELLRKQQARTAEASARLEREYPRQAKRLFRQITAAAEGPRLREAARSEWTRTFRVNRAFALKAGELSGLGEDVFFLYLDEILGWLAGGELSAAAQIPKRQEMYQRYQSLPPLPSMIRGRFDPFIWVKDPHRRLDMYDASRPEERSDTECLQGFAGAAGRIEGRVRVLNRPEDGKLLQSGEILVASTTNVGWTPLFPRAAAIITDIGAPLSHAAIVARELGIPAVVGCGTATSRLRTGDWVAVDGGQGRVRILNT
ncbi:PEP/pyruvate-binding domain-containing protein [Paenibacillus donghaensis]|uniref:Phosphoenolpyruvate synthase n=1 Tax=Paenibacillus donghaensis TaxID=414771 RepID=A0A2Z2KNJ7_9BACL|nr:PEP/pyruvate-binding domain-containing protein [Paenibacillus donghaensis]ASA25173.1 phosphoenolpyruvate synthase [Paenibacillus donghaensis]